MFKEIIKKIEEFKTIIIHRHYRPDGDALGSQIGLKEILKENFKDKKVFAVGDINYNLDFVGQMDDVSDAEYKDALVIALDSSTENMINDQRYKTGKFMIKIDHHLSGKDYANLNYVDTSEISCASLIARDFYNFGYKINKEAAKALFIGIVTDSGRFLYTGVNENTLYISSKLVSEGIDIQEIYSKLYVQDYELLKVKARLTLSMNKTDVGVAYIYTSYEQVKQYNVDIFTISRGFVSVMSGIKNVDIWVNFTEDEDGSVYTEIRSTRFNVSEVAVKYGGGGHKLSCGATLNNKDAIKLVLDDLDNLILEDKNGR